MQNSKFVQLLKTFSKKELLLFGKFVESPYFNKNKHVIALYRNICKWAPAFESKQLERKRLFVRLFPNEVYQENKLQKYMTELVRLLEKFWIYEEIDESSVDHQLRLAEVYKKRGKSNYWNRKLEEVSKRLSREKLIYEDYYFDIFKLHRAIHRGIEEEGNRDKEPRLQDVSDALDRFYLLNKSMYYYKAKNFQSIKPKQEYEFDLMGAVLGAIELGEYDMPALQVYYCGLKCITEFENEANFIELKQLLEERVNRFPSQEIKAMFAIAVNYCIRQLNGGNRAYLHSLFELYQFQIKMGIILTEGKLSSATFNNVVQVATLVKEFDWLEQFFYDYKEKVDEKDYALGLGQLYFNQSRYEDIIQLFRVADYEDPFFVMSAKVILMKTYYELKDEDYDYEEKLEASIINFRAFLNRKKSILPKNYIYYYHLAQKLVELLRLEQLLDLDKDKLRILEESITSSNELAEKRWLLAKVRALLGENKE